MPAKHHTTKEVEAGKAAAVRLHSQGLPASKIALEIGFGRGFVGKCLSEAGIRTNAFADTATWAEAVRLYVGGMSTHTIGNRMGLDPSGISKKLRRLGLSRSKSEAASLMAKNNNGYTGRQGWWQSTKTGKWHPSASSYELTRMQQLDADPLVETWSRDVPAIPYGENKRYIPDFLVVMKDGTRVIEEIKPSFALGMFGNEEKFDAARKFLEGAGICFSVLTEKDLWPTGNKDTQKASLWYSCTKPDIEARNRSYQKNYVIVNKDDLSRKARDRYVATRYKPWSKRAWEVGMPCAM